MSSDDGTILDAIHSWWDGLSEGQQHIIYVLGVAPVFAALLLDIVDAVNIEYWGGLALFGIVNMTVGELFEIESDGLREEIEILGVKIDGIVGKQLAVVSLSITIVFLGRGLRPLVVDGIGTISGLQIIGMLVVTSRVASLFPDAEIGFGRWNKSIFTLGAGLALLPVIVDVVESANIYLPRLLEVALPVAIAGIVFLFEDDRMPLGDTF